MGKVVGLTFPKEGKAKKGGRPTKAELTARLEDLGIDVPEGATNDVLGELVKAAEGAEAE